jgi:hypothetical protein
MTNDVIELNAHQGSISSTFLRGFFAQKIQRLFLTDGDWQIAHGVW